MWNLRSPRQSPVVSDGTPFAKMSTRCWTVLFSVTLAPTLSQFFPVGLSTSIWGSIMTTAVSLLSNFMCGLLLW